jgi:hypothetical protein
MAEIMSAKLIESAVHLCVDMKRTFASGGIWETRRMKRVLPTVIGMTARYPERAIFIAMTPNSAGKRPCNGKASTFRLYGEGGQPAGTAIDLGG